MSSKRLNIVIWREPEKPPITLSIAIPEELARNIQQSKVQATTITIEEHIAVPGIQLGGELDKIKGD
ncbi:MAG: hypothetical protein D4S01_06410 [Dehalococcoidia bacterium]|nr:MAG: hypothetical protein D4S01_06410 [Dehalococcoidia bacterium]